MPSHPTTELPRCGHCQNTTSLLRCSRCKVQHYCSLEHQTSDYTFHRFACRAVFKSFNRMKAEENQLRDHPGDLVTPATPFANSIGEFNEIIGTSEYMRARCAHLKELAQIKSHHSVVAQLDHVMGCLRLCHSYNKGFFDIAPHLMLRLNMDQEAYDLIKWCQAPDNMDGYDWDYMNVQYLNVKDANCFEDAVYLYCGWPDLSSIIAGVLLKIKMLFDLISLQECVNSKEIPTNIPIEIFNIIKDYCVRSSVIRANKDVMESKDQTKQIDKLVKQVKMLYRAADSTNRYFWPALLRPGTNLETRHKSYIRDSISEVQYVLKFTYDAWMETDGAIEAVHAMTKI